MPGDTRGYSWPPFEPGNAAHQSHGARSRDGRNTWRPVADQIRSEALEMAPWLSRPVFQLALEQWAVVEAKLRLVDNWLDEHGLLDAEDRAPPGGVDRRRFEPRR